MNLYEGPSKDHLRTPANSCFVYRAEESPPAIIAAHINVRKSKVEEYIVAGSLGLRRCGRAEDSALCDEAVAEVAFPAAN